MESQAFGRATARCFVSAAFVVTAGVAAAAAPAGCPDLRIHAADLDWVLDQTLGPLRGFVDSRRVSIDPRAAGCYVRFTMTSTALQALGGGACRVDGCSTVIADGTRVALKDFDVAGCDALFDGIGLSRHVPSVYSDASSWVQQHCGSDAYEIVEVHPAYEGAEPVLRFRFRPAVRR